MRTLPPRPPSPPSGPPIGTNFSRRNETIPEPPSPALTFTTARSMNIASLASDSGPQHLCGVEGVRRDDALERGQRLGHPFGRRTDVHGAVQVRVELPLLAARSARGDHAQLAPREIEPGPAEHFSVPLGDHPR